MIRCADVTTAAAKRLAVEGKVRLYVGGEAARYVTRQESEAPDESVIVLIGCRDDVEEYERNALARGLPEGAKVTRDRNNNLVITVGDKTQVYEQFSTVADYFQCEGDGALLFDPVLNMSFKATEHEDSEEVEVVIDGKTAGHLFVSPDESVKDRLAEDFGEELKTAAKVELLDDGEVLASYERLGKPAPKVECPAAPQPTKTCEQPAAKPEPQQETVSVRWWYGSTTTVQIPTGLTGDARIQALQDALIAAGKYPQIQPLSSVSSTCHLVEVLAPSFNGRVNERTLEYHGLVRKWSGRKNSTGPWSEFILPAHWTKDRLVLVIGKMLGAGPGDGYYANTLPDGIADRAVVDVKAGASTASSESILARWWNGKDTQVTIRGGLNGDERYRAIQDALLAAKQYPQKLTTFPEDSCNVVERTPGKFGERVHHAKGHVGKWTIRKGLGAYETHYLPNWWSMDRAKAVIQALVSPTDYETLYAAQDVSPYYTFSMSARIQAKTAEYKTSRGVRFTAPVDANEKTLIIEAAKADPGIKVDAMTGPGYGVSISGKFFSPGAVREALSL